jgi:hypothetical protein
VRIEADWIKSSGRYSAAPQADENLREAVRTRWVEPRRQVAREIVRKGIESGEFRAGLDPDIVLDALYGPFYHRLLVPYDSAAMSDAFIDTFGQDSIRWIATALSAVGHRLLQCGRGGNCAGPEEFVYLKCGPGTTRMLGFAL